MKALREIGLQKAFRFLLYAFWELVFQNLMFPQLRTLWLRLWGAHIGSGTILHQIKLHNMYHSGLNNLYIGKNCFVGHGCSFDLVEKITIGDEVNIGEETVFSTHLKIGYKNHPLQKYFPIKKKPIHIEEGAFIGVGSIILSGTTLGKYSFVSAGSIVSGTIPEWTAVMRAVQNKLIPIKDNYAKSKINH